jgi:hypothetical protein
MSKLYIFVDPQDNSLVLCRAILKNITEINASGVHVHLRKVTSDVQTVANLRSINVTKVPSLVLPSGKVVSGVNSILDILKDIVGGGQRSGSGGRGGDNNTDGTEDAYELLKLQEFNEHVANGGVEDATCGEGETWDPSAEMVKYARSNPRHAETTPIWSEDGPPRQTHQENQGADTDFINDLEDNDADTELLLKQLLG